MHRQRLHLTTNTEEWTQESFANFRLPPSHSGPRVTGAPLLNDNGRFPADGVALQIVFAPLPTAPQPDSRFPIDPSTFHRARYFEFAARNYLPGDRPLELQRTVVGDGVIYTATTITGPHASPVARRELKLIVRSLGFPAEHPGENPAGVFSYGPPSDFRVGSFTFETHHDASPFFLVHAPGRLPLTPCQPRGTCTPTGHFYAVFCDQGENLGPCQPRLDPHDDEFYARDGARWNRVGQPIRAPHGSRLSQAPPLSTRLVTTSWNGQLIIPPISTSISINPAQVRRLWPSWHAR